MMTWYDEKKTIIDYCSSELRKNELESEQKSILRIRDFERMKKHKMRGLEDQEEKHTLLQDYQDDLIAKVKVLDTDLMEYEMMLQVALQDATGKFKDKTKEIIEKKKQCTIAFISNTKEKA